MDYLLCYFDHFIIRWHSFQLVLLYLVKDLAYVIKAHLVRLYLLFVTFFITLT